METHEGLGNGTVSYLASIVAEGTATRVEATSLLHEFVRQADANAVTPRMIAHLRDCVSAFLAGKKILLPSLETGRPKSVVVPITSMEKAFGLTRIATGRAPTDRDVLCQVAMEVLAIRLRDGGSLEDASWEVAEQRKAAGLPLSSESQVREAWANHKADGLTWLRVSRLKDVDPDAPPWTPAEMVWLCDLFGSEPWFVPLGVDANEHITTTLNRLSKPSDERAE